MLTTLFLEQRARIRAKLPGDHKCRGVVRAILLRRVVEAHVLARYPMLATELGPYAAWLFYKTKYNLLENGAQEAQTKGDAEEATDDVPASQASAGSGAGDQEALVSSYASASQVCRFLVAVKTNRWETTLTKLAGASKTGPVATLDLTLSDAAPLAKRLGELDLAYTGDFPPEEPVQHSGSGSLSLGASAAHGEGAARGADDVRGEVVVGVRTQGDYDEKVKAWKAEVREHELSLCREYVGSRAILVLGSLYPDASGVVTKLKRIPLLQEPVRSLFVGDEGCMRAVDWETHGKRKASALKPAQTKLDGDDLRALCEVYGECKGDSADGVSYDIMLVTLLPSGPQDYTHPGIPVVVESIKKMQLVPHMQPPVLGVIEVDRQEVCRRSKARVAFQGVAQYPFLWSSQGKMKFARSSMVHLSGGDTYFNRWPVKASSLGDFPTIPASKLDKFFGTEKTYHDAPEAGSDMECEEEDKDNRIPYPYELPVLFYAEVIEQLKPRVVVALNGGSGNIAKACLSAGRGRAPIAGAEARRSVDRRRRGRAIRRSPARGPGAGAGRSVDRRRDRGSRTGRSRGPGRSHRRAC